MSLKSRVRIRPKIFRREWMEGLPLSRKDAQSAENARIGKSPAPLQYFGNIEFSEG